MAKKRRAPPRSFVWKSTSIAPPQMRSSGPRCLGEGSCPSGARSESSSRLSRRYPARKTTRSTLANSPGWKTRSPTPTQSVAPLIVRPRPGRAGRIEEADRGQAEDVLDAVQLPVVAQEEDERGESADADHDPEALAKRLVRVDAVDHRHADRGQQAGEGKQVGVGVGERDPGDEMGGEEEREEEGGVGERARRELLLAGDVDACEAGSRQQPDRERGSRAPGFEGSPARSPTGSPGPRTA